MESSELALYRGLGSVRNYGIVVLIALFVLSAGSLGALNWLEVNDLHSELAMYSQYLPNPATAKGEQTLNLPPDIIAIQRPPDSRTGFFEIQLQDKDFLAYADPEKRYTLHKSEDSIKHEVQTFAVVILAMYLGEVLLLLGWWFFLRSKVRELFETL